MIPLCPRCEAPMKLRSGTRGEFWGCTTFPTCKGSRNKEPNVQLEFQTTAPVISTHLALDERAVLTRIVKFRLNDGRTVMDILNEDLRTKVTQILKNDL